MRILCSILLSMCLFLNARAQVQIGPKFGVNFNKIADGIDAPKGVEEPFKVGVNWGIASSFRLNKKVYLAPEVLYSQRGTIIKTEYYTDIIKSSYHYVEIPVLLRVAFGENTKGYINAGPTMNYWFGGNVENSFWGKRPIAFVDRQDDIPVGYVGFYNKSVNRMEIGSVIGGGAMVATGSGSLALDIRYNAGLTNLFRKEFMTAKGIKQYKNRGFSLSIIYLLDIR